MDNKLLNYAQIIKKSRIEKNISLEELSNMTGFSVKYLQKLENAEINPYMKDLIKVFSILGLEIKCRNPNPPRKSL